MDQSFIVAHAGVYIGLAVLLDAATKMAVHGDDDDDDDGDEGEEDDDDDDDEADEDGEDEDDDVHRKSALSEAGRV